MALKTSLNSYYKLDEASSTRFDSHGTDNLTETGLVNSTTGKIGNAATGFTSSDYLGCSNANFVVPSGGVLTVAGWVKPGTTDNNLAVCSIYGSYPTDIQWIVRATNFGTVIKAYLRAGGSDYEVSTSITAGVWGWFVAEWDDVNKTVSIRVNNGTAASTGYTGSPASATTNFRVGKDGQSAFDGDIDEISVWDRALTSDERTEIYNSGNGLSYDNWDAIAGQPTAKRWGGVEYSPFAVGMSGIKRW